MNKLKMQTQNFTDENIEKLANLFPNCVTESKDNSGKLKKTIDFDLLKQELSENIIDGPRERYQLNWPGKKESLVNANTPIDKTLRPCREESVDFDTTQNLYIEGDNLEALKLLQESYLGKIKMIYIDPPYNTGKDFIYSDNFTADKEEYDEKSGQKDERGSRLVANLESNGRYHSDWLSMMYPRLKLARNLLKDDGVIFISIDDNEVANLRRICDEIFGEDNFVGAFVINSSPSAIDYGHMGKTHDYALFYVKNNTYATTNQLEEKDKKFKYEDNISPYNLYPLYNGNVAFNPTTRPNLYYPFYLNPNNIIDKDFFEIGLEKKDGWVEVYPVVSRKDGIQRVWRWGKEKASKDLNKEIIGYKSNEGEFRVVQKTRHTSKLIRSLLVDNDLSSRRGTSELENLFEKKIFSFPKTIGLLNRFISIGSNETDIILDFFSGSATTAHSVMQLNSEDDSNRKYICVQIPEEIEEKSEAYKAGYKNICEIGKERIRRAGQKIKEENSDKEGIENLDIGFRVLKIDSSNIKDVYYTPDQMSQSLLDLQEENIKEDRTPEDLLFQIMLDWGIDLTLPITRKEISGKTVYFIDGDTLVACFDDNLDSEFAKEIAKLKPLRAVFKESGYKQDEDKINIDQVILQFSPDTEVRAI